MDTEKVKCAYCGMMVECLWPADHSNCPMCSQPLTRSTSTSAPAFLDADAALRQAAVVPRLAEQQQGVQPTGAVWELIKAAAKEMGCTVTYSHVLDGEVFLDRLTLHTPRGELREELRANESYIAVATRLGLL